MNRTNLDDAPGTVCHKATLFCWECGHDSHIDGDWLRRPGDGFVRYVCPVCETVIAERPRDGDRSGRRQPHNSCPSCDTRGKLSNRQNGRVG